MKSIAALNATSNDAENALLAATRKFLGIYSKRNT
jgi:hypothetical protein